MTDESERRADPFAEAARAEWLRRRRLKRALIALLATCPLVLVIGGWAYLRYAAGSKLSRAIAAADRLDPGWRLAEIEAKRAVVPAAENSAPRVRSAYAQIPRTWLKPKPRGAEGDPDGPSRGAALFEIVAAVDPAVRLDDDQAAGLRAELAELAGAVAEARGLAGFPRGRYPLSIAPNFLATHFPHVQEARQVARLLQLDVMLRAQEGDIDGALDSCRALMNVGRSIGNEPTTISQLVRMAIEGVSLTAVQRTLAQGQASDAALAKVQDLLADESAQPLLLTAIRGDRAGFDGLLRNLASGEVSLGELGGPAEPGRTDPIKGVLFASAWFRYNRGLTLEFMNRAVEIAKRPTYEQPGLWECWGEQVKTPKEYVGMTSGALAYLLLPALDAVHVSYLRSRAQLNGAWLMIALERYRLAHGRWPDPLSADAIHPPADPWTGAPMRFTRIDGGWAVYSVGPDRTDNGGKFHPTGQVGPGTDVGYRLYDIDRRRRPPEAKAPKPAP